MGSLDLPDQPDRAERAMQADAGGPGRPTPRHRELPDPDERGRAYEAMRAHIAETPDESSPGRAPDAADQRGYWDEVPRFCEIWADHERRWPERRPVTESDRSSDPLGTYRSKGGLKLNPEQHAETKEAIGHMREAEGPISADMQIIGKENTNDGWLEGFERRLKGEDRLKEKVAERREGEPDKTLGEIVCEVPDAIRYTFCIRSDRYTKGYYDLKERLESRGYEMYESRNSWNGAEYKGINTRWVTQEGQRFEVQFHTPESFHAKQYVTHTAYERIRNLLTSDEERAELKVFHREVCVHIKVPNGARYIPHFKKKGF